MCCGSLTALALLVALGAAGPARAAEALPEGGWKPLRVGMLPVRSYVRTPDDIFQEHAGAARLREASGLWQRRIERALAGLDMVRLTPSTDALKRTLERTRHREATALARERYTLGVERYRALATEEAIVQLQRAAELYAEAQGDIAEAREVAEVQMYLGLAYLERGDRNAAHMAFRQMWLLDPGRYVDKGYYPEVVEQAMAGALVDLTRLSDKARLRFPAEQLSRLAADAKLDVWVMALIDGSVSEPVLVVSIFDTRSRIVVLDARVPLSEDGDGPEAEDLLERELSAWHACAVEADDRPLVRRWIQPRWSVDLGYTHTLFLRHSSTRSLFHSPGMGLAVSWQSRSALHVFVDFTQMVSAPDGNRDLLDSFVTSRLAAGAGLTGGSRRVRAFIQAGVEVGVTFTDIEMSTDPDCKHFGSEHPRCKGYFRQDSPAAWLGLAFDTGLRVGLGDTWYLMGRVGFTAYVASDALVGRLNFPVGLTLGVGSRF
ncbi:MAG: hypothetical protein H6744_02675 [Deltaproteobacteria bacterium]|nr:hypothetical protein [Deltaproteobacteria bacterium]MCB9785577.1 hypothetical protein [Deltaproteobacteria bacterium]